MKQLSHNLLSVMKLNEKGLKVQFYTKTLISGPGVRVEGKNNGKLYTITLNLNDKSALLTEKTNSNLWHRRMGHLNYGGMKILGLPLSKERCSICMEAKGARCSFASPQNQEQRKLENWSTVILEDQSHLQTKMKKDIT
ncbi:unnamed protein product [Arctia plantaginis]|uniref:GAG-pre-integrase domain-containing protein n=1 Tax=Arctia plantaginis TaxID=874455 RepID=A0A8S0YXS8_ARCPL|nr:unnamed protein product [Arctia plantaginis]